MATERDVPELPEVERVARTIAARIVGRRVGAVRLNRRDICESRRAGRPGRTCQNDLLLGAGIAAVRRHGKQLAVLADDGRVLCVHLGMSGSLTWGHKPPRARHVHAWWRITDLSGGTAGWMVFRDPRRFGGLWTFDSMTDLTATRWRLLGPDALTITSARLAAALRDSRRAIKAALLDQTVLAGVGNIYADEALFRAGVRPDFAAGSLTAPIARRLAAAIRGVLRASIRAGGSTLRDFKDAESAPGEYQRSHAVYGRAGRPCVVCGKVLRSMRVAQRTTVFCPGCQAQSPAETAAKRRET